MTTKKSSEKTLPTPPAVPLSPLAQAPLAQAPLALAASAAPEPAALSNELARARTSAEREQRFRKAAQQQNAELMEQNMVLIAQRDEAMERVRFLENQIAQMASERLAQAA